MSWEDVARQVAERAEEAAGEALEATPWPVAPTPDAVLDALAVRQAASGRHDPEALAAARRWSRELDGRRGAREPVDLWVAGGFERPRERELWTWSLASGVALILPKDNARRVATVLWARPTVASGDRAEAAALVQGLRERPAPRLLAWSRRLRGERLLPLGRLHSLVVTGPEPPTDEDRTWLEASGVRVLHELNDAAP